MIDPPPGRYIGYCRGGPYDGMRLVHWHKVMQVPLVKAVGVKESDRVAVGLPLDVEFGEYHWVLDQWIWQR